MISSIVTHPGGAHKDDFLACAVLLTEHPVAIERRDPSDEDLNNPAIAVLDIGYSHDPALSNFDHHQLPRDHVPTCALSLILQHLGLYEDAREFCDWLEVAEWFDCRGPKDTAEWLGIDRQTLGRLNSPLDITLLKCFAAQTEHKPGEPVWEIMLQVGQDLVDYVRQARAQIDYVAKHAEIWTLQSGEAEFKAIYMPRTEPLPAEPSAGLGRYVIQEGLETEVIAMIAPDSRGIGYGMRRFNDDERMDFTKLSEESDVHFAHARGFIAKSSATEVARLKDLLVKAFVGPTM